ncbi:hypothetical protein LguiA_018843 [Lonicera macranthoides]
MEYLHELGVYWVIYYIPRFLAHESLHHDSSCTESTTLYMPRIGTPPPSKNKIKLPNP